MRDPAFKPDLIRRFEDVFADVTVDHYPDVGHFVPDEAAPEAAEDISRFLAAPREAREHVVLSGSAVGNDPNELIGCTRGGRRCSSFDPIFVNRRSQLQLFDSVLSTSRDLIQIEKELS